MSLKRYPSEITSIEEEDEDIDEGEDDVFPNLQEQNHSSYSYKDTSEECNSTDDGETLSSKSEESKTLSSDGAQDIQNDDEKPLGDTQDEETNPSAELTSTDDHLQIKDGLHSNDESVLKTNGKIRNNLQESFEKYEQLAPECEHLRSNLSFPDEDKHSENGSNDRSQESEHTAAEPEQGSESRLSESGVNTNRSETEEKDSFGTLATENDVTEKNVIPSSSGLVEDLDKEKQAVSELDNEKNTLQKYIETPPDEAKENADHLHGDHQKEDLVQDDESTEIIIKKQDELFEGSKQDTTTLSEATQKEDESLNYTTCAADAIHTAAHRETLEESEFIGKDFEEAIEESVDAPKLEETGDGFEKQTGLEIGCQSELVKDEETLLLADMKKEVLSAIKKTIRLDSELIGEIAMDWSPLFVGGLIGERDIDRIPVFVGELIGAQSELIGERDIDRIPVFVGELIGERDVDRIAVIKRKRKITAQPKVKTKPSIDDPSLLKGIQCANDIRKLVFVSWYSERLRTETAKMHQQKLENEKSRIKKEEEEKEKVMLGGKVYKRWLKEKDEKMEKENKRRKKFILQKKAKETEEELEKKTGAKKVYESWKQRKEDEFKKKLKASKKKTKDESDALEQKKMAEQLYIFWQKNVEEKLKKQKIDDKKKEQSSSLNQTMKKEERDKVALEAYRQWIQVKHSGIIKAKIYCGEKFTVRPWYG
ncbi:hypothetical protein GQR58_024581 [Nymphon striatum]|nr:hypothetical protein GQR58_024581 [Nymphon striatum]